VADAAGPVAQAPVPGAIRHGAASGPWRDALPYLGAFAVVAALLAALVIYNSALLREQREQNAIAAASNVITLAEARLDATVRRARAQIELLLSEVAESDLTDQTSPARRKQLRDMMVLSLRHFPEVADAFVVDARGVQRYHTWDAPPQDHEKRTWFRSIRDNPRGKVVFSEVMVGAQSGQPVVVMALPLRGPSGAFYGAVAMSLDLYQFESQVRRLNFGQLGFFSIRRSDDGSLMLRWPPAPAKLNLPAATGETAPILAGARVGTTRYTSPDDRIERTIVFNQLDSAPFAVSAGIAEEDYLAEWRFAVLGATLLALVALLAVGAFFYVSWSSAREQRLALLALARNEQQLRVTMDTMDAGVWIRDLHKVIVDCNDACCRMMGLPREDMLGHVSLPEGWKFEPEETFAGRPDDRPAAVVLRTGRPVNGKVYRLHRPVGSPLWLSINARPVTDGRGRMTAVVIVLNDITEMRAART
jgi:PAS domain S-box-containing protein